MIEEARIIEAIVQSGVKKVVLLDDAFDAPALDATFAPRVLEYVISESFKGTSGQIGLGPADIVRIREAIERTEYDADAIAVAVEKLYEKYKENRRSEFDPGGMFRELKGAILDELDPLIALLAKCDKVTVHHLGRQGDLGDAGDADVIFADYFLLDPQTAFTELRHNDAVKDAALAASYDRVIALVEQAKAGKRPSIILMSSQDMKNEAESYRAKIRKGEDEDLIYSSSFAFMKKDEVTGDRKAVKIAAEAAEALLDVFQTFEFGRSLHGALDTWFESAKTGVDEMQREIAKLGVKDFAYLIKFRLMEEGESLLEYLEWFFGECLLDGVARAFNSSVEAKKWEEKVTENEAQRLEGAFDGPTDKIAELYHRVRIARPRPVRPKNYRLGDLYLSKAGTKFSISALVNPECDLILRNKKRKAQKLLTVGGTLKPLTSPASSVADFILIEDEGGKTRPFLINWDLKDLDTHLTEENVSEAERTAQLWPAPGASTASQKHVGTLKPLYAQQLQRSVLTDLGRPGLPVAPAIAMAAGCKLHIVKLGEGLAFETVPVGKIGEAHCWVIHSAKPKIVFARGFVTELVSALKGIDRTTYVPPTVELDAKTVRGFYDKLCSKGIELGAGCFGVEVVATLPKTRVAGKFAWLVVSGLEPEAD